jgi:hypothetical protein
VWHISATLYQTCERMRRFPEESRPVLAAERSAVPVKNATRKAGLPPAALFRACRQPTSAPCGATVDILRLSETRWLAIRSLAEGERRMDAPPGFEPGWRFCRFRQVLDPVHSSCSLVSGTARFCTVLGRSVLGRSRTEVGLKFWFTPVVFKRGTTECAYRKGESPSQVP